MERSRRIFDDVREEEVDNLWESDFGLLYGLQFLHNLGTILFHVYCGIGKL